MRLIACVLDTSAGSNLIKIASWAQAGIEIFYNLTILSLSVQIIPGQIIPGQIKREQSFFT